jgi:WD40 repeat protein
LEAQDLAPATPDRRPKMGNRAWRHWVAVSIAATLSAGVLGAEEAKPVPAISRMSAAGGEVEADLQRPLPAGALMRLGTTRLRHDGSVIAVAFTPDGKSLVSSGYMDTIRVWDTGTGRQIRVLGEESRETFALALSPDGKRLITGGAAVGDKLRVWDFATGTVVMSALGDQNGVYHLALSPEGQTFATAGVDGNVYLWKMENGLEFIETPLGGSARGGGICCLAFSLDGKLLAAGDGGGMVQIWEVGSEKEPLIVEAHGGWVNSIAFVPGGKALATAGGHYERGRRSASEIRHWDPATGRKVLEYKVDPNESIATIVISPDGHMLASVGGGGSVVL